MSKFLYPIYKLNIESYKKWWLYHKKAGGSGVLSEILEGFSFNLENTLNRKFKLFEIEGNSVQDGSPSPDNEVPILSSGDNGSINEKIINENIFDGIMEQGDIPSYNGQNQNNTLCIRSKNYIPLEPSTAYFFERFGLLTDSVGLRFYDKDKNYLSSETTSMGYNVKTKAFTTGNNVYYMRFTDWTNNLSNTYMLSKGNKSVPYVPHEEQDYSIFVQQPMRSIGDVRDCFVKVNGNWYERHLPYIASYNGETLPQDVYNEVDNVKYCNEKSMSTTGQFSIGASVQYIDENNWNDLPCTQAQIDVLENLPSTYKDFTIIQSEDTTPAHLKIQYYKEG